jgi:hypothetical protein
MAHGSAISLSDFFVGYSVGRLRNSYWHSSRHGAQPQHRPVPDTDVLLKAKTSDYLQKTQTDANGEFHFDAIAPRGICGQRLDCSVRKRSAERDSALRSGARFALSLNHLNIC